MTKKQLYRHLTLMNKDLLKVRVRMEKISDKLGIDRGHEYVERTLWELEQLLKMFEDKENVSEEV